MDLFFQDPTDIPLPPQEVRLKDLRIEPWADGQRVRVFLEVTPFMKRPNLEVMIFSASAEPVAQVSVIETMSRKLEFTMHLRQEKPRGAYIARAVLYYDPPLAEKETVPESSLEPVIIDRLEVSFEIEA